MGFKNTQPIRTTQTDLRGKPVWPDMFGNLKMVMPFTLADLVNKYEVDAYEYSTNLATGGTVTHVPAQSAITVAVTGASGSTAQLRTNQFFRYQAGKTQQWRTTVACADAGQANQVRRWGYFNDTNGLFFAVNATTVQVVLRSDVSGSVVDTPINQSAWNYDKMDGTGPSSLTLDVTKQNIYEGSFQWLGAGNVQFYINGFLVHEQVNLGVNAVPYMRTAQLPMSWEIINSGASVASSFNYVCMTVLSNGGELPHNISFGIGNTSAISVSTERPVLTIRPTALYNSVTNRMSIIPFQMSVQTAQAGLTFRLVYNATLTGPSFNSVDATSGAEFDVAATALSGGVTLMQSDLPNHPDAAVFLLDRVFQDVVRGRKLRQNAFATALDTLTIACTSDGGATNVKSSLTWEEIR